MDEFSSIAAALGMVAAFALMVGGAKLAADRQTRTRGILMIVAALVIVMNVTILTV